MTVIYEASVYMRTISYRNFKGEEKTVDLAFSLDPIQLLQVIAKVPSKTSRSANPAKAGQVEPLTEEAQIKFFREIAVQSAGSASEDGESWLPWEGFGDELAGKAFLTKLASSDGDRREFATMVIIDPFRAFVKYAENDPTNKPQEIQQLKQMQAQLEDLFKIPEEKEETLEERKARLAAELAAIEGPTEGTQA